MSATEQENQDGGEVFSLFEPCHSGDRFTPRLERLMKEDSTHCADFILDVSKCNFNEAQHLAKWTSIKTSNDHKPYSKSVAHKMCSRATTVAVKTVEPFALANATWVLDANPHLKIIELIRDPRGIYASKNWNEGAMEKTCSIYKENMKVSHPRIKKVLFENLVKSPKSMAKSIYSFLGMKWGEQQDDWVRATFNADCSKNATGATQRHQDCHSDSAKVAREWRSKLGAKSKEAFNKNEDCSHIAKTLNFHEFDDDSDFEFEAKVEALAEDE